MKPKRKKISEASAAASAEDRIATYWDKHDATEVLDLAKAQRVDLIFEPPVKSISLRLPVPLLNRIKQIAANMDVAYQNLIKIWLAERVGKN